jgi:hypothetical protein
MHRTSPLAPQAPRLPAAAAPQRGRPVSGSRMPEPPPDLPPATRFPTYLPAGHWVKELRKQPELTMMRAAIDEARAICITLETGLLAQLADLATRLALAEARMDALEARPAAPVPPWEGEPEGPPRAQKRSQEPAGAAPMAWAEKWATR